MVAWDPKLQVPKSAADRLRNGRGMVQPGLQSERLDIVSFLAYLHIVLPSNVGKTLFCLLICL